MCPKYLTYRHHISYLDYDFVTIYTTYMEYNFHVCIGASTISRQHIGIQLHSFIGVMHYYVTLVSLGKPIRMWSIDQGIVHCITEIIRSLVGLFVYRTHYVKKLIFFFSFKKRKIYKNTEKSSQGFANKFKM